MLARTMLAAAGLAVSALAQVPRPEPFEWEPDLASATEAAKRSGRPIAAYFTFDT